MALNVLFAAPVEVWGDFPQLLATRLTARGIDAVIAADLPPAEVDYIVYAPNGPVSDFSVFPRLKAVFGLWAGVERIVGNPTLTVPLTRMVEQGLEEGMTEYVAGHVLRYHLGMDAFITNPGHEWRYRVPPLARQRTVGILGLGALGAAAARALAALNFRVLGWSRSPKTIAGVDCRAGEAGLAEVLAAAEILVLLLPSTPATANLLDATRLALLPEGAFLINPGRGTLIDDDALLAALNAGRIAAATLDVFRTEPLPAGHPYWLHPNVTVTAHVAADTRIETSVDVVAENLRRAEAGEPLNYLVDRSAGY